MFIQPFHDFDSHNASLSEGGALAVVVGDFHETPHQTRTTRFSRVLCGKAYCGAGALARRTREVLVVGATRFWPVMHHGVGTGYSCLYSSFSPAS